MEFYPLTEKGLTLIPVVLTIVLRGAQRDAESGVLLSSEFLPHVSRRPVKVCKQVRTNVRGDACVLSHAGE